MGSVNLKEWFDSTYGGGTGRGFWNREDYSTPNNVPAWDALSSAQKLEFLKTGGISSLGFQDKAPNWAGAFDNRTPEQVLASGNVNFADPQGNEGIGGMLKTLGVFAGAAGLGGLMGGGLGGLPGAGSSFGAQIPGEFGLATGGAGTGAGTMSFDLFNPSTWFSSGVNMNPPVLPEGFVDEFAGANVAPTAGPVTTTTFPFSPGSSLFNNAGSVANAAKSLFSGNSGVGALLGALAGGIGANSKPAGMVTSVQDIPDYLKPYQSMNLASGVNNFSQAGQGASLLPGAQNYLQNTINGQYLDPNTNPAFQPYVKDLMGQAGSAFTARYGATPEALNNSGNQEGFTRAVTAAALPLYNQAFQTAQGNQFNAAQNAPAFANNVAGAAFAPNLAFKNLYTGPQTNSQPYFTSTAGGILSGGLAGSQIGKLFG